ncbi:MAG: phosphoadenylyl-sulfate reductase [Planctomycetes bacterium]|nr:phosphoadenylyl-sulfate reductase [Planctomycetota bacterium]
MEPEIRHIAKTDYAKHRVVRSDGEVTIDGVYPERAAGVYMVRVRVPGGIMTLAQARALASFAHQYANGEWHVDTRANVELHGVPEDRLLPFIEAIETSGLSTRGACGDSVRNIVTGSESASASVDRLNALVDRLTRMFMGKPEFETLPRKFKIAFYARDDREPLHRINDLGFVEEEGGTFEVWVGGGLGKQPRLADLLFKRVPELAVPGLVAATVQIHNAWSNRKNRAQARLKFVLEEHGVEQLRDWILEKWVPPLEVELKPQPSLSPPPARFDASGVHAQQNGAFKVRVPIVAGDITGEQVVKLVDAAEAAGAKLLHLSVRQNIAIPDVAHANVPALVAELERLGYPPSGWFGARDIVACPGASSCRKGFVETHEFAQVLSRELESVAAPGFAKRLRISVSGCPNSCSQPQLFDLGFRGNAGKARGAVVKGYDLLIGGRLYGRTLLGQQFASLLSQEDLLAAAKAGVLAYAALAVADEPFDALIDRVGLHKFAGELATRVELKQGEWTEVLRDDLPRESPTDVEAFEARLETKSPRQILRWGVETFGESLLVSSALNAGGVLLAHYLRELAPAHPVFLIDTGKLFAETLAYAAQLREQFGLKVVLVGPAFAEPEFTDRYGERLWQRDPALCCHIRKVQVMAELRKGKRAWVSALRQEQGGERADVGVLEREADGVLKLSPLALVTREWVDEELRTLGIPQHPLLAKGYRSLGCAPCTQPVDEQQGERDGRWHGTGKTECGLHEYWKATVGHE